MVQISGTLSPAYNPSVLDVVVHKCGARSTERRAMALTTGQKKYYEKLKDPRWQKLRLKILERDDWACQVCRGKEEMLVVHHRWYENDKEPWEYAEDALVTMCQQCHGYEGGRRQEAEAKLIRALKRVFFVDDLSNLEYGFSHIKLQSRSDEVSCAYQWAIGSPDFQASILEELRKGDKT